MLTTRNEEHLVDQPIAGASAWATVSYQRRRVHDEPERQANFSGKLSAFTNGDISATVSNTLGFPIYC